MSTINALIESLDDKKRVKYERGRLVVRSAGSKIADIVIVTFFLFMLSLYFFNAYSHGFSKYDTSQALLVLGGSLVLLLLKTKGDNKLTVNFDKKEIKIQKRFILLQFMPPLTIDFDKIDVFGISIGPDGNSDSYETRSCDIYAIRIHVVIKKIILITFDESEKKAAEILLAFLKRTVLEHKVKQKE